MATKHILALLLILLMVSITPASAIRISENTGNLDNSAYQTQQTTNNDLEINGMTTDLDNIQSLINRINYDVENLKSDSKRLVTLWWNPWCWKITFGLIKDIFIQLKDIRISAKELRKIANEMRLEAEKIESENAQNNTNYIENESQSYVNAKEMSKELEKRLSVKFTPEPLKDNIKEGDIVQYKSQDKYYRYLSVYKIDANESFAVLEGSEGKRINVEKNRLYNIVAYKLVTSGPVNIKYVTSEANRIQL